MSLSTITFQMRHSKGMEQVSFSGNNITLLDFKRLVIEKKKVVQSLDFDLKVVDANSNKGKDIPTTQSLILTHSCIF